MLRVLPAEFSPGYRNEKCVLRAAKEETGENTSQGELN